MRWQHGPRRRGLQIRLPPKPHSHGARDHAGGFVLHAVAGVRHRHDGEVFLHELPGAAQGVGEQNGGVAQALAPSFGKLFCLVHNIEKLANYGYAAERRVLL